MEESFLTYESFLKEFEVYELDQCDKCGGIRELEETEVNIIIQDRELSINPLTVLRCKSCGRTVLPYYSKRLIDGVYKNMVSKNQYYGIFEPKEYIERFAYCVDQNFKYDHKDYYNIPGLIVDDEHSNIGFLTPVFFLRKALIFFISSSEFAVDIFSETYGQLAKKNLSGFYSYEWAVPFGFNSNGLLVLWLGDIDSMDNTSKDLLKVFNVESDHQLIDSEFYRAQLKCEFSEPIIEKQIIQNKEIFIRNIREKYGVDLSHLVDECSVEERKIQRPIEFNEESVSRVINAYHKILVEGFNIVELRHLYEMLYSESERKKEYKDYKSIKLIEALLLKMCPNPQAINIMQIMSPLYILNDYRNYFDHLLSETDREETMNHIVSTLNATDFSHQEEIYAEEIARLNKLFQYLVVLSK